MKQANDSFDLPRLTEADPGLAEELTLLKAQLPDASELALMASRLQLQGIDVTSPAAAPSATAPPWAKWLLVGGGAVAVGLGLWAGGKPAAPATAGSPQEMASSSGALPAAATVGPRPPRSEAAVARHGLVHGASPIVEGPADPAVVTPSSPSAPARVQPGAVRAPEPPRAAASGAASTALGAGSLSPTSSGGAGSTSAGPSPQSTTAPTEIELLREARLALKRSPATALELAEQHTRTYPGGKLAQERELIAVSALIALGRRTAALGRAAHFERAFPQSPYRKQLAELLR